MATKVLGALTPLEPAINVHSIDFDLLILFLDHFYGLVDARLHQCHPRMELLDELKLVSEVLVIFALVVAKRFERFHGFCSLLVDGVDLFLDFHDARADVGVLMRGSFFDV